MRDTRGKDVLEVRTVGDRDLADVLVTALSAQERVDRVTHGFHTYPAGLHPDAARDLLSAVGGTSLYDPFCGGGTVLVEGLLAGRRVVGRDVSVVAQLVARVRTMRTDDAMRTAMRSTARTLAAAARQADPTPPPDLDPRLADWYAPHVLAELTVLRDGIESADVPDDVRELLWGVFSSILIKVSWRKSDTRALREVHDRPAGTTAVLFHKKARELGRRLTALEEAIPEGTPRADVRWADARAPLQGPPVDVILTSPPYPGVYDYVALQELREAWLGVHGPRQDEIGSRRDFRDEGRKAAAGRYARATHAWVEAATAGAAPGGRLVVVVGDGLVREGPVDAAAPTLAAASSAGWALQASARLARPDHARRSRRWEHVFAFQRG